jgi:hypothetical protein
MIPNIIDYCKCLDHGKAASTDTRSRRMVIMAMYRLKHTLPDAAIERGLLQVFCIH